MCVCVISAGRRDGGKGGEKERETERMAERRREKEGEGKAEGEGASETILKILSSQRAWKDARTPRINKGDYMGKFLHTTRG